HLALVEKELSKTKQNLAVARTRADDLDKMLAGLNSKLTATDAELIKKRGELELLNKQLELAKKVVSELDVLVRNKEQARSDLESKLKSSDKKLDEVTRSVGDQTKM